jgi:DUF1680 family protein
MSMNLHCDQIELQQTPTYITYMCMVDSDGEVQGELTGKNARRALEIYCFWRLYQGQVAFNQDNGNKDFLDRAREEVKTIKEMFKQETSLKALRVYIS